MAETFSFQQAAWPRLKKNKGVVFGLAVNGLSVIVALFAYFIAPDNSPFANRQILEIRTKKPGFKQSFLKVKKEREIPSTNFFNKLISGGEDKYHYVPIAGSEQKSDSLIVQKFIDEDVSERQAYHISQVDPQHPVIAKKFILGT